MDISVADELETETPGRSLARQALPDKTLFVIQSTRVPALNLGEIWAHRELLYFLVWRDLKVRYKQTALGVAWVVLQPLLMTIIFTVVLGKLVKVPTNDIPYPLFAFAGIILWTFFSGAISIIGNSLLANANLITKVYFPRLIIPIAAVIARLVDLGFAFIMLFGLILYYRVPITPRLLMALPIILLSALLALGFGTWTSAVNVKYRDVGQALPVLIQLWMFVSPVVYGLNLVPPRWRLAYSINPLVGLLEGFRAALFGKGFDWSAIAISVGFTLFFLVYGTYSFKAREKTFADII